VQFVSESLRTNRLIAELSNDAGEVYSQAIP